ITDKLLFQGDHVMAVLAKILFEEPPRLRQVCPEVPEAVDALLSRMLAKSAGSRFKDASALVAALDAMGELVLEGLHWGDVLTVKLCGTALRELTGCPLMVLALARPEVDQLFPELWSGVTHVVILNPLSKKAGERLARQVLGPEASRETVARIALQ